MQFWDHLVVTFSGRSKSGKTSSHASSEEVSSSILLEEAGEPKLSKYSQQRQSQINRPVTYIGSLEAQSKKISQLLEPKLKVNAVTQTVVSNLNIGKDKQPNSSSSGYTGKSYLGKPYLTQLAPGVDRSLYPALMWPVL